MEYQDRKLEAVKLAEKAIWEICLEYEVPPTAIIDKLGE